MATETRPPGAGAAPAPAQRIVRCSSSTTTPPRGGHGVERERLAPGVGVARFAPARATAELHLRIEPEAGGSFERQLAEVGERYRDALRRLDLAPETAVFRRFYLSDAANQIDPLMRSELGFGGDPAAAAAVSCVEQPVLPHRKVALQAWHVADVKGENKWLCRLPEAGANAHALALERSARTWLWSAQMTAGSHDRDGADQTRELFRHYDTLLAGHGATLGDHVVRTWLFVDGVDRNYLDVVRARRELFAEHGLTERSHYIVSTGIEGRGQSADDLVLLDALAVVGLAPGQLSYIDDLDHLNRTSDYGVTFERAARLDHGDRSHFLVAGTASIDGKGDIVHPGDLVGQVDRTIENIQALLDAGGAGLEDVTLMTAYLRDPADAELAAARLEAIAPGLPWTLVQAPVCRPGWLIEIEAMAAVVSADPRWPRF